MNKDVIKEILYIIIAIMLAVFAVNFIIWLLPIIIIAALSYYIYKSIKKNGKKINKNKPETKSKKTIKIIEMIDEE